MMPGRIVSLLDDLEAIETLNLPLAERDRLIEERVALLLMPGTPELAAGDRRHNLRALQRQLLAAATTRRDAFAKAAALIGRHLGGE